MKDPQKKPPKQAARSWASMEYAFEQHAAVTGWARLAPWLLVVALVALWWVGSWLIPLLYVPGDRVVQVFVGLVVALVLIVGGALLYARPRMRRVLTWLPVNAWRVASRSWRGRDLLIVCPLEGELRATRNLHEGDADSYARTSNGRLFAAIVLGVGQRTKSRQGYLWANGWLSKIFAAEFVGAGLDARGQFAVRVRVTSQLVENAQPVVVDLAQLLETINDKLRAHEVDKAAGSTRQAPSFDDLELVPAAPLVSQEAVWSWTKWFQRERVASAVASEETLAIGQEGVEIIVEAIKAIVGRLERVEEGVRPLADIPGDLASLQRQLSALDRRTFRGDRMIVVEAMVTVLRGLDGDDAPEVLLQQLMQRLHKLLPGGSVKEQLYEGLSWRSYLDGPLQPPRARDTDTQRVVPPEGPRPPQLPPARGPARPSPVPARRPPPPPTPPPPPLADIEGAD